MTDEFRVVQSTPAMAEDLAAIQKACFPTLAPEEQITAAHYRAQMKVFPEGQLAVITQSSRPVACSTDLICSMDFDHYQHRYIDAVGNNWLGTHDPDGDWLYGADIGVLPEFRGKGLSTMLYNARKDLVRRLNLKGHLAGGYLRNYGAVKDKMSASAYVKKVEAGDMFDSTLSIQLKRGFRVHGIIEDYVDDPMCANKAALIVWDNPDYKE
jgi:GNAT superfamily N-acetyltransferase